VSAVFESEVSSIDVRHLWGGRGILTARALSGLASQCASALGKRPKACPKFAVVAETKGTKGFVGGHVKHKTKKKTLQRVRTKEHSYNGKQVTYRRPFTRGKATP